MNEQFLEILEKIILKSPLCDSYNHTFHNQKYELNEILKDIIYVLKTGISWRNIRGNIKWQSLVHHFNKFKKEKIFKKAYSKFLRVYKKNIKENDIIYLTDTSFIKNNIGTSKLGRNPSFKNKNCFKVSLLTDINGIPLDISVGAGNVQEKKYMDRHIKYVIKNKSIKETTLMADKGYDSKLTRKILSDNRIHSIIPFNKRNTKDPSKIKHLTDIERKQYRRRIKIENTFSWIKKNKRIY